MQLDLPVLLVRLDLRDPLVEQDLRDRLDPVDLLGQTVVTEATVVQAQLVVKDLLDLVDRLAPQGLRDLRDHRVRLVVLHSSTILVPQQQTVTPVQVK